MMRCFTRAVGCVLLAFAVLGRASAAPTPFDQQAASIQALAPVGTDVVYAGSFGLGMFRSTDRGVTWTKSGEGLSDPFILSLVSTKDGVVYAGTFRGGIFRTKDQGKSWQPLNAGLKRKEIKALLAVSDVVYAGTSDGVYRLKDDHWSVVTTGLDDVLVHSLAQSADGTLYAGTSGKGVLRYKRSEERRVGTECICGRAARRVQQ